jgi:hypothetical protein
VRHGVTPPGVFAFRIELLRCVFATVYSRKR